LDKSSAIFSELQWTKWWFWPSSPVYSMTCFPLFFCLHNLGVVDQM
jgi:hypothetical protein